MNTIILFLILNFVLFLAFEIKDSISKDRNFLRDRYGGYEKYLTEIYGHLGTGQINELLEETWSRPAVYEPFTQFKERPYEGKYVNVYEHGYRHTTNQGTWPPNPENLNIFLFGGSTTFNYGVSDGETISSYLQQFLNEKSNKIVKIYNFGRAYYYSTQERVLFEKLIISGFIPDMAIFIDGLNEFYYEVDEPAFTKRFKELLDGKNLQTLPLLTKKLPLFRAVHSLKNRLVNIFEENTQSKKNKKSTRGKYAYDDKIVISDIIARYVSNKKMIEVFSNAYGIKEVFVWQPVPMYKYALKYHSFYRGGFGRHTYAKFGYPEMEAYMKKDLIKENFLWCAGIQEGISEPLYVDLFHYSPQMSKRLARCIHNLMTETDLWPIQATFSQPQGE
jgi:hypothetical protein